MEPFLAARRPSPLLQQLSLKVWTTPRALELQDRMKWYRARLAGSWGLDKAWKDEFKLKSKSAQTITFDVFDTALTRIVEAPVDVFAVTEALMRDGLGDAFEGLAVARETAEQTARHAASSRFTEEVALADLFAELAAAHPEWAMYMPLIEAVELEVEAQTCCPVAGILWAYHYSLEHEKRVVFVSDMYLPTENINDLLRRAGYSEPLEVHVSSENRLTKASGRQWDRLSKKFGGAARLLHIGDDPWSDRDVPAAQGIACLPYTRAKSMRRRGGPLTPDIIIPSLIQRSAHLDRLARRVTPATMIADTAHSLGRGWGALVLGAFVRWVFDRAKLLGVDRLCFCARDGLLPYEAWKAMNMHIEGLETRYICVSRQALVLGSLALGSSRDQLSEAALTFLSSTYKRLSVGQLIERAGLLDLGPLVADAKRQWHRLDARLEDTQKNDFKQLLQRHAPGIYNVLQERLANAVGYLKQEGLFSGRVALVDLGWHGNMQHAIKKIGWSQGIDTDLYGFYFGLWPGASRVRAAAGWLEAAFTSDFRPLSEGFGLMNAVALLENLCCANHGSTVGYMNQGNGRGFEPILAPYSVEAHHFERVVRHFQTGVLESLADRSDTRHIFDSADLTLRSAREAIDRLALSPSKEEINCLGQIRHAADAGHTEYVALVPEVDQLWQLQDQVSDFRAQIFVRDWPVASALAIAQASDESARDAILQSLTARFDQLDQRSRAQFQ